MSVDRSGVGCYGDLAFAGEAEQRSKADSQKLKTSEQKDVRGLAETRRLPFISALQDSHKPRAKSLVFCLCLGRDSRLHDVSPPVVGWVGGPLLFRKASDVSPGAKPRPPLSFVSLLPGGDGVAPVAILCQTLPHSVEGSSQAVKQDTKWHSRVSRWRGTNRRRRPDPVQSVKYPRYCEEKTV